MPRGPLVAVTGRDPNPKNHLAKTDVAEAVASGRFGLDRKTKKTEELIEARATGRPWPAGGRPRNSRSAPRRRN
jgi:hypothetical protein